MGPRDQLQRRPGSAAERPSTSTTRPASACARSSNAATALRRSERIYLGGFEIYRELAPNGTDVDLERETLHVMDDKQRIALVETETIHRTDADVTGPVPLQRYQLGNHLGSASVELDADGALISYEEYHPHGTTAFRRGAAQPRRA